MAATLPRNRLGLARWMVDRSNPLFARVTVNRFWQEFFGAGIVESADDFGVQARTPSHPELLDWLAVEFRESGWDVKKLITLIVTSAAYRQSAAMSQEKLTQRPDEPSAGAGTAISSRRRSRARFGACGKRPACQEAGWSSGEALPARRRVGRHVDGCEQYEELQAGYGRVAVPTQPLHVVEASGAACIDGHLRWADARGLRCSPRADEHADAGAGDDERSAVCRGGACAGTARHAVDDRPGGRAPRVTDRREWRDRLHGGSRAGTRIHARRAQHRAQRVRRLRQRTTTPIRRRPRSCLPSALLRPIERFLRRSSPR